MYSLVLECIHLYSLVMGNCCSFEKNFYGNDVLEKNTANIEKKSL